MAADPDEIADNVLTWLSTQDADKLVEVCTTITLTCSEEKKGKKCTLLKHVLNHLCDLETGEDKGMSTLLLINDLIEKKAKPIIPVKLESNKVLRTREEMLFMF